jgi:hypothetical protein
MRALFALIALTVCTGMAHAATCDEQATEKKLAGAAKSSFVKKCEKDTAAAKPANDCDAKAAEKKLAGAAKNSFVKKCAADAAASK